MPSGTAEYGQRPLKVACVPIPSPEKNAICEHLVRDPHIVRRRDWRRPNLHIDLHIVTGAS